MAAALLVAGIAAAAGLFVFVGYKFGARAKAQAVKYEQEGKQLYIDAHSKVSAKLASVKAEIAKIESEFTGGLSEAESKAKAIVARVKSLL